MSVIAGDVAGSDQVSVPRPMDRGSIGILGLGHICTDLTQSSVPTMLPYFIVKYGLSYSAAARLALALPTLESAQIALRTRTCTASRGRTSFRKVSGSP